MRNKELQLQDSVVELQIMVNNISNEIKLISELLGKEEAKEFRVFLMDRHDHNKLIFTKGNNPNLIRKLNDLHSKLQIEITEAITMGKFKTRDKNCNEKVDKEELMEIPEFTGELPEEMEINGFEIMEDYDQPEWPEITLGCTSIEELLEVMKIRLNKFCYIYKMLSRS